MVQIYNDLGRAQQIISQNHPNPRPLLVFGSGEWGAIIGWLLYRNYIHDKRQNFVEDPLGVPKVGYYVKAYIDDEVKGDLDGVSIHAPDSLEAFLSDNVNEIVVGVGHNMKRVEIYKQLEEKGFKLPTIISPTNSFGGNNVVGKGTVILENNCFNIGAEVGDYNLIYVNVVLSRDVHTGKGVYIAPNVFVGAYTDIGDYTFIGEGVHIKENENKGSLSIGMSAFLAMGAFVKQDVPDGNLAFGNPAKMRRVRVKRERF